MRISKNTQKAGIALIGSMLGFIIAKKYSPKETYPFILIGGFIGNVIAEEMLPEPSRGIVQPHYENL